ncbi:MAG: hypothetical protein R3B68_12570 [Phycisphaerales bacterium]
MLHLAVAMVLVLAMWLFVYWAYRTLRSDRTRAAFGLDPRTQI